MTAPTNLNWKSSTAEQRNDACACFMPPSEINPIRSWHLNLGNTDLGAMMVQTQKEADDFKTLIDTCPHQQWKHRALSKYTSWDRRTELRLVEHRRSVNYSTTPGGAWMLLDQLMAEGYMIAIAARAGLTALTAERYEENKPIIVTPTQSSALGPQSSVFEGSEPFSELAAMLFLTLNGVKIEQ
jgi:hypothetical protein